MSDREVLTDHPILRVLQRVLVPGKDEQFILDERGARLLEHGLLEFGNDSSLPSAVEGIFALCSGLFDAAESPTAARRILEVLVSCRDRLPALSAGRTAARIERAESALDRFSGGKGARAAPMHGTQAPEGSLKVSSLLSSGGSRFPR